MIKQLASMTLAIALSMPIASNSATLVVNWIDPTPTGPAYVAGYSAEYRVNGGMATSIPGLVSTSIDTTISAVPSDTVEVRYRAINNVAAASPINGNWSPWYPASQAVTPGDQQAPTFVLFVY